MTAATVSETPIDRRRLGMWLFLGSDAMVFVSLLGAYLVLQYSLGFRFSEGGAGVVYSRLSTLALLVAVLEANVAASPSLPRAALYGTAIFGSVSALSGMVRIYLLTQHGVTPRSGAGATIFLALYGCFVLHLIVASGVTWAAAIAHAGRTVVSNLRLWWNFLLGVWIVVLPILMFLR